MAEDQGVNGDKWTDEATILFERMNWYKIADSNIDVPGSEGQMHGIDSIFSYFDGFKPDKRQGVFIEAKRYKTTSYNLGKLKEWVTIIDKKIRELKSSGVFLERYAEVSEVSLRNGVIAIWFHDVENYPAFREKFKESLRRVKVPRGQASSNINRLFVLENDRIKRLCSTLESIAKWNAEHKVDLVDTSLSFVYPSSTMSGYAVQVSKTMNLEYAFSQFLFMQGKELENDEVIDVDVVFYYGEIDSMNSFYRLREAMLTFDRLNAENNLYLYIYQQSDEFRKIEPDVKRMLEMEGPKVEFRKMTKYLSLPDWMQL